MATPENLPDQLGQALESFSWFWTGPRAVRAGGRKELRRNPEISWGHGFWTSQVNATRGSWPYY